jgi:hypothetical protein
LTNEPLSKQQKALVLRQQLASINAELQRLEFDNFDLYGIGNALEDEDELEAPACRVAALHASTEIRHNAAEDPSTRDGQKENERRASIKVGEVPMLILSPTSSEVQRARKAAKAIRAPISLCVAHSTLSRARSPHGYETYRFIGPLEHRIH